MKLKSMYLAGCLLALVSLGACTKDEDETLNDVDTNFMVKSAYSNLAEIDQGQLAATKGTNASVKNHGANMVVEHSKAHVDLVAIALSKNVSLPTEPDEENKAVKQKLLTLSGKEFDVAFMEAQVTGHKKSVANFETELANGVNKDVRGYAGEYFPHIKIHLQQAETILQNIK